MRLRIKGRDNVGLVVDKHLVTVDHSVKEHLITTVNGNPKISTLACGLQVSSLFTRVKMSGKGRRDRQARLIGDNCPLLYALKRKDNLVTNVSSVRLLAKSAYQILDTIVDEMAAELVVCMPSGYSLSRIVGKRCANAFGACLMTDVFRKTTKLEAYDMLHRAEQNGDLSTSDKRRLDYRLKKSDGFSLKDIPVPDRHYFEPIRLNPACTGAIRGRVVLVDDLLASGRTLSVATSLIRRMTGVTSISAVCLFSDV